LLTVGADDEGSAKRLCGKGLKPVLQRRSSPRFERACRLGIQLATLYPGAFRAVGGCVDGDRDRAHEYESERDPEGEKNAPVERVHAQSVGAGDAARAETRVSA